MQLTVSDPVTTRTFGGGPGSPFGPAGPDGPAGPAAPCGPGGPRSPLGPAGPCAPASLRALRSDGAGWARRTGSAALANGALWTDGSLRTLCTLGASRTDRPGRASFARRSGRTLRPRCRTATRHDNDGDGSRTRQQLSHRHFPRGEQHCTCTSPRVKRRKDGRKSRHANVLLELAASDGNAKLPLINTRALGFRWWLSGRSFQRSALQSSSPG